MKSLLIFLFALPLQLSAQSFQGVWVGILHNDSTEMDLNYEIVISEHKGKLSGFSYTNFIVDGRSYTGVKSLLINKRFGKLYIEDDKLVYNNYDFEPPKGVRQASILEPSSVEEMLSGRFTTTRTKQYGKPVTGHIYLLKKENRDVSKLMEILSGLDMTAGLSFLPQEQQSIAVIPEKDEMVKTVEQPAKIAEPIVKKEVPVTVSTPATSTTKTEVAVSKVATKPTIQQQLATRKIETLQTIWFTADSLVLELYDNGYVDGDTVTIVINGLSFLNNIRLSEKAYKTTIKLTPSMGDSLNLVMFAENLGSISPNSGLAIIRDGKKEYRVAFSGDLQKNAAIMLRRKKE